MQLDPKYDCTFGRTYSTRLSPEDEDDVCDDMELEDNCFEDTVVTNRTIEIGDEGEIEVIIDIGSDDDLTEFEYYEELPKCVGQGFIEFFTDSGSIVSYDIDEDGNLIGATAGDATVVTTLAGTDVTLTIREPDPLMTWHFSGTSVQEERIQYELSELQDELTSECLRQFRGGVTDVDDGTTDPDTDSAACGIAGGTFDSTSSIYFSGTATASCCGDDGEVYFPARTAYDSTTTNYYELGSAVCCTTGTTFVAPDGSCINVDPCTAFLTYWLPTDSCGSICSDKGLCPSDTSCDADPDCSSRVCDYGACM